MTTPSTSADITVDGHRTALRHPPAEAAGPHRRSGAAGSVVHVIATDPAAPLDLPAWCPVTGHTYLGPVPDCLPRTSYGREQGLRRALGSSPCSLRHTVATTASAPLVRWPSLRAPR